MGPRHIFAAQISPFHNPEWLYSVLCFPHIAKNKILQEALDSGLMHPLLWMLTSFLIVKDNGWVLLLLRLQVTRVYFLGFLLLEVPRSLQMSGVFRVYKSSEPFKVACGCQICIRRPRKAESGCNVLLGDLTSMNLVPRFGSFAL